MDGIIAAGALAPQALREQGIERIPLLRVQGETILARTCRCLREGGGCETVHVLAPESVALPDLPGVRRAAYSGELVGDIMNCLARDCAGEAVLLASGDMPLITAEAVAAVCAFARESGADVVYPAVEKPDVERRFPGTKRTYVKLGGRVVTGGNVFWLGRGWIMGQSGLLKELFAQRKNPLGLAKVFGLGFFLRILLGIASVDYIERHLSRVLKGKLRAAVIPYPELAVDLDKQADLETFASYLDPTV